jgi:hypothetical protein
MACKDCVNIGRTLRVPDYHTTDGFFACWNWAKEQEWWNKFLDIQMNRITWNTEDYAHWYVKLVNPATFAPILAEWLKVKP